MTSKLFSKLHNSEYRKAFVASQINMGIPFQLRALLRDSRWTQQELAGRADMRQPRISAMLKPGGAKFTLETLRRLAEAFDVGLMVKFVPFSELAQWSYEFDPDGFHVASFDAEMGEIIGSVARATTTETRSADDDLARMIEWFGKVDADFEERAEATAVGADITTVNQGFASATGSARHAGTEN